MASHPPPPLPDRRGYLTGLQVLCRVMKLAQQAYATADAIRIEKAVMQVQAASDQLRELKVWLCANSGLTATRGKDCLGLADSTSLIESLEEQVRHLNQVQSAYLRRARRTVDVFNRIFAEAESTYRVPPRPTSARKGGDPCRD